VLEGVAAFRTSVSAGLKRRETILEGYSVCCNPFCCINEMVMGRFSNCCPWQRNYENPIRIKRQTDGLYVSSERDEMRDDIQMKKIGIIIDW